MIPEMELKLESVLHWETGRLIFLEDLGVPPWEEGCNVLIKSFQIWPTYKERDDMMLSPAFLNWIGESTNLKVIRRGR